MNDGDMCRLSDVVLELFPRRSDIPIEDFNSDFFNMSLQPSNFIFRKIDRLLNHDKLEISKR